MNSNFMKLNPSKLLNPDCPLEAFPIVGASLLAKFFASKLAPTVGPWPNGQSGFSCRVDKRSASTIIGYRWMRCAYPPYGLQNFSRSDSFLVGNTSRLQTHFILEEASSYIRA